MALTKPEIKSLDQLKKVADDIIRGSSSLREVKAPVGETKDGRPTFEFNPEDSVHTALQKVSMNTNKDIQVTGGNRSDAFMKNKIDAKEKKLKKAGKKGQQLVAELDNFAAKLEARHHDGKSTDVGFFSNRHLIKWDGASAKDLSASGYEFVKQMARDGARILFDKFHFHVDKGPDDFKDIAEEFKVKGWKEFDNMLGLESSSRQPSAKMIKSIKKAYKEGLEERKRIKEAQLESIKF